MRYAFDLVFAPDDGIEAVFFGQFGYISAEIVEYRRTRFGIAPAAPLLVARLVFIVIVGVVLFGGRLSKRLYEACIAEILLLTGILQFGLVHIVVNVELMENFGSRKILMFENRQHQMLGGYFVAAQRFGFQQGYFEHALGVLIERQRAHIEHRRRSRQLLDGLPDLETQLIRRDFERFEHPNRKAVAVFDDAHQDMFGANEIMAQTQGCLAAAGNDLLDFGREFLIIHKKRLLRVRFRDE